MSAPRDFSKARVGDKVWSHKYGHGSVVSTERHLDRSIVVEFHKVRAGYAKDGRIFRDELPDLYWSEPTITGGDVPPKRRVKKELSGFAVINKFDEKAEIRCFLYTESEAEGVRSWNEVVVPLRGEYEVEG